MIITRKGGNRGASHSIERIKRVPCHNTPFEFRECEYPTISGEMHALPLR